MACLQQRIDGSWKTVHVFDVDAPTTLGRGKDNDVIVNDPHCSRCQAEICFDEGTWMIRDVGSQNGTQISGRLIESSSAVAHGDILTIGQCEYLFLSDVDTKTLGSVSAWVKNLQDESKVDRAQYELLGRYYKRLSRIARAKLDGLPRRVADEEDAVVGAFHCFFEGVQEGRFPDLDDRSDLWNVLTTIAVRKVCRQIERETAAKRGGGQVRGESVFADQSGLGLENVARERSDDELRLEFEDTWRNYIDGLPSDELRRIIELRLVGFTNMEIANKLQIPLRTVQRRIQTTRSLWDERFARD